MSIGVYVFTNGNEKRKNLIRMLLYVYLGVIAVAAFILIQKEEAGALEAVYKLADSEWFGYLPVAGWSVMFFKGILTGSVLKIAISLGLFLLISILFIVMLAGNEADYYEDVLHSTEVTFQRMMDAKEGRNVSTTVNRQIKVKEKGHGINRGKGASVFVYKHLVEMKRSSKILFIDSYSIIVSIIIGIVGYFLNDDNMSYTILTTLVYMQFFFTVFGRLKIELIKPYIYLIPESAFKKLLAASISSVLKPCVDAVLFFGILALVGGAGILQCIFMALAYIASGVVFVGLTVVYQRVFGSQPNMLARAFIGIILFIVALVPGIAASVLVTIYLLPESLYFMATLPFTIVCLMAALIMIFACRNLIDKAEYSEKYM